MNVTLRYWKSPVLHSDGSLQYRTQKRSKVRSIYINNNYIVDLLFIDYVFFINNNDTNYEEFGETLSIHWTLWDCWLSRKAPKQKSCK